MAHIIPTCMSPFRNVCSMEWQEITLTLSLPPSFLHNWKKDVLCAAVQWHMAFFRKGLNIGWRHWIFLVSKGRRLRLHDNSLLKRERLREREEDDDQLFSMTTGGRTRRNLPNLQQRLRFDTRKNFLAIRIAKHQCKIPRVVESPSLFFKSRLHKLVSAMT